MRREYIYIGAGIAVLLLLGFLLLSLFGPTSETEAPAAGFGIGDNRTVAVVETSTSTNQPLEALAPPTPQPIFQIANGPIAGATLIEQSNPTTTVVRYVRQDTGHVLDLTLDIPGAAPQSRSNTTIPGVTRTVWVQGGNGVILQYLAEEVVKSVYLGFPAPTTTTSTVSRAVRIQFLPDNIRDIAAEPNGNRIAYLLSTASGVAGYTANADGSGSAVLFSLPLSQVTLQWPAQDALLAVTKSASGVPGTAFTVNTASGVVTPILYAEGLTATANPTFSNVLYQVAAAGETMPKTYLYEIQAGQNRAVSFEPTPGKCAWSALEVSVIYCATPIAQVPANYADLWRLGVASMPDSIFRFDLLANLPPEVLAIPGADGGMQADVAELALAPGERYLSYIKRPDRSLWGVRLVRTQ